MSSNIFSVNHVIVTRTTEKKRSIILFKALLIERQNTNLNSRVLPDLHYVIQFLFDVCYSTMSSMMNVIMWARNHNYSSSAAIIKYTLIIFLKTEEHKGCRVNWNQCQCSTVSFDLKNNLKDLVNNKCISIAHFWGKLYYNSLGVITVFLSVKLIKLDDFICNDLLKYRLLMYHMTSIIY